MLRTNIREEIIEICESNARAELGLTARHLRDFERNREERHLRSEHSRHLNGITRPEVASLVTLTVILPHPRSRKSAESRAFRERIAITDPDVCVREQSVFVGRARGCGREVAKWLFLHK